ncbi:MAG: EAL domain-containing protein [Magnetococcales bacterium]|nr:EAL domain-containing protein [Magnetococcales bacterium]
MNVHCFTDYNPTILEKMIEPFNVPESFDEYQSVFKQEDGASIGLYHDFQVSSVFQPIFSPAHSRVIGYEGLIRGRNRQGDAISPATIFNKPKSLKESLYLDRLSRLLHVSNFSKNYSGQAYLFLNFSPKAILIANEMQLSTFTKDMVEYYGIKPEQVVIEILESAISDDSALIEVVEQYRACGFQIAIDDFGAGESNIDRIWKLSPNIIKLDRSLISNTSNNQRAKRLLPSLVNFIHQIGGLVLLEGIETKEEAMIAVDSDVDLVQGFVFAKPQAKFQESCTDNGLFKYLSATLHNEEAVSSHKQLCWLSAKAGDFSDEVKRATQGSLSPEILNNNDALRWYILDGNGRQIEENYDTKVIGQSSAEASYNPMKFAKNADWSRRPYYRRSMRYPGELQISGPYFSIPDSGFCITFSLAKKSGSETRVYCCDFKWQDNEAGHSHLISGSMGPW